MCQQSLCVCTYGTIFSLVCKYYIKKNIINTNPLTFFFNSVSLTKIVTIQWIELFSHGTGTYKSASCFSQYCDEEVTSPAPFFCIIMTVVTYLYGRFNDCRPFNASEMMLLLQSSILALLLRS